MIADTMRMVRLGLKSLMLHKLRSTLTTAGILFGVAGVLLAPLLYFWDFIDKPTMKGAMAVATAVWFVCGGAVRARALRSGS